MPSWVATVRPITLMDLDHELTIRTMLYLFGLSIKLLYFSSLVPSRIGRLLLEKGNNLLYRWIPTSRDDYDYPGQDSRRLTWQLVGL